MAEHERHVTWKTEMVLGSYLTPGQSLSKGRPSEVNDCKPVGAFQSFNQSEHFNDQLLFLNTI